MRFFYLLFVVGITVGYSFPASAWTFCANENNVCDTPNFAQVRYGADGKYTYRLVMDDTRCNNGVFGDPAPNIVKHCHYKAVSESDLVPVGEFTFCANENSKCDFTGLRSVRYGADGKFSYWFVEDGVRCNNANFGDPAPNIVKHCYIRQLKLP